MKFSTREITEAAMAVALHAVLSYLVLYRLPQGGVIGLSMLPIFFIAMRHGLKMGIITGIVAGTVQMLMDPFFVHPFQVFLDYQGAWGALGLTGLFSHRRISPYLASLLGVVAGAVGRFVFHYASGVWFFAHFAPAGMAVWYYVATYILSHLVPSAALCLVALWALRASGIFGRHSEHRQAAG